MSEGVIEAVPNGSVVDVRLRETTLDEARRSSLAARLKSHTNLAFNQIRDVENYAALTNCRREHLLRHFGDTEDVAPCAGCDVCLGETSPAEPAPLEVPLSNGSSAPQRATAVDTELFERLRGWRGDQARSQKVPAYVILHNSHLEEISSSKPANIHELGNVKGIGLRRAARYGEDILKIVHGETVEAAPSETDYSSHLDNARSLLNEGRGADAVPELARALKAGGEEAHRAVNELLKSTD
jgi:superfamily II DNA helicase RecQ